MLFPQSPLQKYLPTLIPLLCCRPLCEQCMLPPELVLALCPYLNGRAQQTTSHVSLHRLPALPIITGLLFQQNQNKGVLAIPLQQMKIFISWVTVRKPPGTVKPFQESEKKPCLNELTDRSAFFTRQIKHHMEPVPSGGGLTAPVLVRSHPLPSSLILSFLWVHSHIKCLRSMAEVILYRHLYKQLLLSCSVSALWLVFLASSEGKDNWLLSLEQALCPLPCMAISLVAPSFCFPCFPATDSMTKNLRHLRTSL